LNELNQSLLFYINIIENLGSFLSFLFLLVDLLRLLSEGFFVTIKRIQKKNYNNVCILPILSKIVKLVRGFALLITAFVSILFNGFKKLKLDILSFTQIGLIGVELVIFLIDGSSGVSGSGSGNNNGNNSNNSNNNNFDPKGTANANAIIISITQKVVEAGMQLGSMLIVAGVILTAISGIGYLLVRNSQGNNNNDQNDNAIQPPTYTNRPQTNAEAIREQANLAKENEKLDQNEKPGFLQDKYYPGPPDDPDALD